MVILDIRVPDGMKLTDELKAVLYDDGSAFEEISGILRDEVEGTLRAGDFIPLKPETLEKKRRLGQPDSPLTATGTLARTLQSGANQKKHRAFVRRGKSEVYGFFHQFGAGRNEKREWMKLDDAVEGRIVSVYQADLTDRLEKFSARMV